jgi:flagellar brake protein
MGAQPFFPTSATVATPMRFADSRPTAFDTLPMPLDVVAAAHGGLEDFRITAAVELATMLKRLMDGNVAVNLVAPNGVAVTVKLSTCHAERGVISFNARHHLEADQAALQALIECNEAVAVGYLDSVKVQFDLHSLVLVHHGDASAVSCSYPQEIFRFQRRNGFRVRPLMSEAPTARLRHPVFPEVELNLRVLDVSTGGCALFLPEDAPMIEPGVVMHSVTLELDADTTVSLPLRLQHVSSLQLDARGVRLGCEWIELGSGTLRTLQRYIDLTQKARRQMARD